MRFWSTYLQKSPRWLIKKGRNEDAAKSIGILLGHEADAEEVEIELNEIRTNLAEEQHMGSTGYIDCFKPGPKKLPLRTLTGIFIQAWYVTIKIFSWKVSFFKILIGNNLRA
jgi:SP family sugar:H+ symporter-like MFS transporter